MMCSPPSMVASILLEERLFKALTFPTFMIMDLLHLKKVAQKKDDTIPHEVVESIFLQKESPIKAWRTYLHLTQAEVAGKMGISQAAFSQK